MLGFVRSMATPLAVETERQGPFHERRHQASNYNTKFQLPLRKTVGRVDVFRRLVNAEVVAGHHKWQLFRTAVQCEICKRRIKGFATHCEIAAKEPKRCPGAGKTMEDTMKQLAEDTAHQSLSDPAHWWFLRDSSFGCHRCWQKIARRSGKAALTALQKSECIAGLVTKADLDIKGRLHPSHQLQQHGEWLECQRCWKTTKWADNRRKQWVAIR